MANLPLPLLQQISVASPCSANWADMIGDNRTRRCAQCSLEVHNLSEMTADEAEAFLRARAGTGRVCGRFYRRPDGTILTKDCPVGLAKWRRSVAHAVARVGAAALFLCTAAWTLASRDRAERLRDKQPFRSIIAWLAPPAAPPVVPPPVMGDICIPTPTPPPTTTAPTAVPAPANPVPGTVSR